MISLSDRLRGGVIGLLVGDALGVPYEFHRRMTLLLAQRSNLTLPRTFVAHKLPYSLGPGPTIVPPALALLASRNHCGKLDVDDFGRRLVNCYEPGYASRF